MLVRASAQARLESMYPFMSIFGSVTLDDGHMLRLSVCLSVADSPYDEAERPANKLAPC